MSILSRFVKTVAAVGACVSLAVPIASAQLKGGPNDDTSRHARGSGGGIVLFDQAGFRGEAAEYNGPVGHLNESGRFNDRAGSLQVLGGRWEVCVDFWFSGLCKVVDRDVYDLRNIGLNNNISSVSPVGYREQMERDAPIVLYSREGFRGEVIGLYGDERQLESQKFNDRASSIRINSGVWIVCSGRDLQGECEYIDRSVSRLESLGLNNRITSIGRAEGIPREDYGDVPRGDRPRGNRPRVGNDGYNSGSNFGGNAGGYEGEDTVFFPRPTDRFGNPLENGSRRATRFCRDLGLRGAAYKGDGRYLKDVLCEK